MKQHLNDIKINILKRSLILCIISAAIAGDPIINIWYIGIRENPIYNHYIEIYNPTEEIIDLSEYAFIKGHAQTGAIGYGWGSELSNSGVSFYRLSGSLFPGSSMGFTRDASHESLQNAADVVFEGECVLSVSGDDAVGLFKGAGENAEEVLNACDSIPIDAIGTPFDDPGQSWQVSGVTGPANSTNTGFYGVTRFAVLMRKPDIGVGNAGDWDASRGCIVDSCSNDTITTSYEASEWEVLPCYFYDGCDPTNDVTTNGAGAEPDCPDASLDIDSMGTYYYDPGTPAVDSTQVQIIHNSPYPTVDVYLDGEIALESVSYRASTGLITIPLNTEVGIAPAGGDVIATFPFELELDVTYVVVASGIVGNETHPFDLLASGLELEAEDEGSFALKVMHGVTDAPAVDIYADGNILVENLAYGDFQGYLQVPVGDYTLDITAHGSSESVASFSAPLETYGGYSGVVYASGFLNPAENDSAFTLILTTPSGYDVELPPSESALSIDPATDVIPSSITIVGNFPNPFNPSTKIVFELPTVSEITMSIFTLSGKLEKKINLGMLKNGTHTATWDGTSDNGRHSSSGVYIYKLSNGQRTVTGKMTLIK